LSTTKERRGAVVQTPSSVQNQNIAAYHRFRTHQRKGRGFDEKGRGEGRERLSGYYSGSQENLSKKRGELLLLERKKGGQRKR